MKNTPKLIAAFAVAAGIGMAAGAGMLGISARADSPQGMQSPRAANVPKGRPVTRMTLPDSEWRKKLTPQQFNVLREEGTEAPYSGANWNNHDKGTYVCAACGLPLFSSDTKFESGTGWPSYFQPLVKSAVVEKTDSTLGMSRTEVECARCGGHLGHVFDDGPNPTGLRYCMNSVSLKFVPAAKKGK